MTEAPACPQARCQTLGVSAEAAAVLLAYAMRESEAPALALGEALERMVRAQRPAGAGPAQVVEDLTACVRALQFHDRLMQQLAVVRNLLTTLADDPAPVLPGCGAQRWQELLAALRARIAADSRHELFGRLLLSGTLGTQGGSALEPAEGTVELF
jgi:hypothetical protein